MFVLKHLHILDAIDEPRLGAGFAVQPMVEPALPVYARPILERFVLAVQIAIVHQTLRATGGELETGALDVVEGAVLHT